MNRVKHEEHTIWNSYTLRNNSLLSLTPILRHIFIGFFFPPVNPEILQHCNWKRFYFPGRASVSLLWSLGEHTRSTQIPGLLLCAECLPFQVPSQPRLRCLRKLCSQRLGLLNLVFFFKKFNSWSIAFPKQSFNLFFQFLGMDMLEFRLVLH